MKRQKLLLCLIMVALSLALAAPALATCSVSGHILYSYTDSTLTSYYYVAPIVPPGVPSYYTFFRTTAYQYQFMMGSAEAGNRYINVTGDAATCPTTGTARNGGAVTNIRIYTLD